mmetsp:Transcript_13941/g.41523  ORF Transcript_13941/g.41523 Transcript_13941/m.41523 type:complete len:277 (-) Transcript_13941:17-847(-)
MRLRLLCYSAAARFATPLSLPTAALLLGWFSAAPFVAALSLSTPPLPPLPSLDADLRATHGFSDAANWLVPGRVLVGANPTKGRGSALNRITAICEAGCGTFVTLEEEGEARNDGYELELNAVAENPVFERWPIQDLRPARDLEYLDEIVGALAARVRAGENLYLHCFAGRGRTGLLACGLLGELYDVDAEEALARVGAYYALRAGYGVAGSRAADGYSPETEPQRDQVRDYFARKKAEDVPFDGLSCGAFKMQVLATDTPRSVSSQTWEPRSEVD